MKIRTASDIAKIDPRRANIDAPPPMDYAAVRETDEFDTSMAVMTVQPRGVKHYAQAAAWGSPLAHKWGRELMLDQLYPVPVSSRVTGNASRLAPKFEYTAWRMACWFVAHNGLVPAGMNSQDVVQSACAVLCSMEQPLSLDSVLLMAVVLVHDDTLASELLEEDLLAFIDDASKGSVIPIEWLD